MDAVFISVLFFHCYEFLRAVALELNRLKSDKIQVGHPTLLLNVQLDHTTTPFDLPPQTKPTQQLLNFLQDALTIWYSDGQAAETEQVHKTFAFFIAIEMQRNHHDITAFVFILLIGVYFGVCLLEKDHLVGEGVHFLELIQVEHYCSRGGHAGDVVALQLFVLPVHYNQYNGVYLVLEVQQSIRSHSSMFLLNLFGKSNNLSDEQKYDRINFKIDLNENVPKMQEWAENEYQEEEELTPHHPQYYDIFPKEQQKFIEYVTNENDTISGLAIKLDISEKNIRSLNSLSGSIYPGMKIKLPENTDLSKLELVPSPKPKVRISQIVNEKSPQNINAKYTVYYNVGLNGKIKGTLTINSNYLIFNPSLDDPENVEKFTGGVERLLKFNAIVETVDIQDAMFMEIPLMEESQNPRKEAVVQFMLYRVGNSKIEKKYKERLKQLKIDHKAIASMTFITAGQSEQEACEVGEQLVTKLKSIISDIEAKGEVADMQEKNRLTNIPFFDIIHENIHPKAEQVVQKAVTGKIINSSAVLGNFAQPSDILTEQEFANIVKKMPVLYQLYNWTKAYGSTRDGSSFPTFLNRINGVEPAILIIKEHKGFKFGAFVTDFIRLGKSGRGEMFIFTFKGTTQPEVYQWTGGNEFFVYVEKDMGIGIGMGFKYGIYVKNDFDSGSTAPTTTFGNKQILSKKEDFYIDEVEVWGIDMSY